MQGAGSLPGTHYSLALLLGAMAETVVVVVPVATTAVLLLLVGLLMCQVLLRRLQRLVQQWALRKLCMLHLMVRLLLRILRVRGHPRVQRPCLQLCPGLLPLCVF